ALAFADRLCRRRIVLHAATRNFSGSMEPAFDQQPSLSRDCLSGVDTGARTRAGIRLDRQLHSGHRLLLDSEASADETFRSVGPLDFMVTVVFGGDAALDSRRLRMALAHIV